ncbi:MAG: DinB family protein [Alicyclobacillus sp.]|nr:DinB family protein [Alicyclobacillus sp.]
MSSTHQFPFCNDLRDCFYETYAKLTPQQLDWQVPGSRNSIGFSLRHIAQSEDWFVNFVVLGHEVPLKRKSDLPTIVEILAYLRDTRAHTLSVLDSLPPERLSEVRSLGDGFRGRPRDVTVGWIFHRVFQHEAYHYGQVNLMMRQQGLEPPQM